MHIKRFKNYHELIGHGDGQSREHALLCLSSALSAADTYAGAKLIKIGAPIRGEMVTKYNRLMQIEEHLGPEAMYGGKALFGQSL